MARWMKINFLPLRISMRVSKPYVGDYPIGLDSVQPKFLCSEVLKLLEFLRVN